MSGLDFPPFLLHLSLALSDNPLHPPLTLVWLRLQEVYLGTILATNDECAVRFNFIYYSHSCTRVLPERAVTCTNEQAWPHCRFTDSPNFPSSQLKLEHVKTKHPQLVYEYKVYRILQGGTGIPTVYWCGVEGMLSFFDMLLYTILSTQAIFPLSSLLRHLHSRVK